ncbi:MAG: hypothetical protein LBS16_03220 [Prevotellaceae bacterium]|jgi:hypothetical protein|nr:hypothetical protein [Prevotellaceae bacterium]
MNKFLVAVSLMLVLVCCTTEKRRADLSGIDFDVEIGRFDKDFWALKGSDYAVTLPALQAKYPDFLPVYLEHILEFGSVEDSLTRVELARFFADTTVAHLYTDALTAYEHVDDIEKKLTDAFRRGHYFFPNLPIPKCYMHASGLNQSVVIGDGFISLSIDNYLGTDYPIYQGVIYNYLIRNMIRSKAPSDYVIAWLSSEFPFSPTSGQLLEELIYHGKIMYLTSILMPDEKEHLLIGYTEAQWSWCKKYERDMWMTLIENKHLFTTENIWRAKYLNDAPFTSPFTQESPGRAGVYIGWQIIESYMQRNATVTPLELILDLDAQHLLENSGYNPK